MLGQSGGVGVQRSGRAGGAGAWETDRKRGVRAWGMVSGLWIARCVLRDEARYVMDRKGELSLACWVSGYLRPPDN